MEPSVELLVKPLICETHLRVRYSETDGMAVVYHANYLPWFEVARNEYCRLVGYPYTELERQEGAQLMVTQLSIKYHSPTFFDDEILVKTWCEDTKRASCVFGYQIFDETTGKLAVEGWSEHAAVNKTTGKLQRFSPHLYQILSENCGAGPSKFVARRK